MEQSRNSTFLTSSEENNAQSRDSESFIGILRNSDFNGWAKIGLNENFY